MSPRPVPASRRRPDLWARGQARVDAASLTLFRIVVGLLLCASALRFELRGWVDTLIVEPSFHFHYWGFEWISEPSPWLAHALVALTAVAGLGIAWGRALRGWSLTAFCSFTWLELVDLSYYLNHYYFVSILLLSFTLIPPRPQADGQIPRWWLWFFRAQVGMVYAYAGLAKLDADWLLHAQPLKIWLARSADLPGIGPWLDEPWVAYAAAWAGAAFDLLVVPLLCVARTRRLAYAALLSFHLFTGLLFPIGVFPWLMSAAATIFFAPAWPRRVPLLGFTRLEEPTTSKASESAAVQTSGATPLELLRRAAAALALGLLFIELALPLRHWAQPGPVAWNEVGGRFAWRVMLVEKGGAVRFEVVDETTGARSHFEGDEELTDLQKKAMSTQPDMIAEYARHLRARAEAERPEGRFVVYVHARVSVNGRPSRPFIDPNVDLSRAEFGLATPTWILPSPLDGNDEPRK